MWSVWWSCFSLNKNMVFSLHGCHTLQWVWVLTANLHITIVFGECLKKSKWMKKLHTVALSLMYWCSVFATLFDSLMMHSILQRDSVEPSFPQYILILIITIGLWQRATVQLGKRKWASLKLPLLNVNTDRCCAPCFKPAACFEITQRDQAYYGPVVCPCFGLFKN